MITRNPVSVAMGRGVVWFAERPFGFMFTTALCMFLPLGVAGGIAADPGPAIWKWVIFILISSLFSGMGFLLAVFSMEDELGRFRFVPPMLAVALVIGLQVVSNGSAGIGFIREAGML